MQGFPKAVRRIRVDKAAGSDDPRLEKMQYGKPQQQRAMADSLRPPAAPKKVKRASHQKQEEKPKKRRIDQIYVVLM